MPDCVVGNYRLSQKSMLCKSAHEGASTGYRLNGAGLIGASKPLRSRAGMRGERGGIEVKKSRATAWVVPTRGGVRVGRSGQDRSRQEDRGRSRTKGRIKAQGTWHHGDGESHQQLYKLFSCQLV